MSGASRHRHAFEGLPGAAGRGDGATPGAVGLEPWPRCGLVDLRGDPADGVFAGKVEAAFGVGPPVIPNTTAEFAEGAILWLAPDHWLAVTPALRGESTAAALEAAFAGSHAAATDVGDQFAAMALSGPAAGDVLAKGCALDLHARAFPPGRVARTMLARVRVVLWRSGGSRFTLLVERSLTEYVWCWLGDAGREFGMTVGGPGG